MLRQRRQRLQRGDTRVVFGQVDACHHRVPQCQCLHVAAAIDGRHGYRAPDAQAQHRDEARRRARHQRIDCRTGVLYATRQSGVLVVTTGIAGAVVIEAEYIEPGQRQLVAELTQRPVAADELVPVRCAQHHARAARHRGSTQQAEQRTIGRTEEEWFQPRHEPQRRVIGQRRSQGCIPGGACGRGCTGVRCGTGLSEGRIIDATGRTAIGYRRHGTRLLQPGSHLAQRLPGDLVDRAQLEETLQ